MIDQVPVLKPVGMTLYQPPRNARPSAPSLNAPTSSAWSSVGRYPRGWRSNLDRDQSLEDLAVGRYVVARGRRARFFCMITDVALDSTNPMIAKQPPDVSDPFLAAIYQGTTTFGTVHLSPLLIMEEGKEEVKPVKTVPEHFTPVATASQVEVDQVFGPEGSVTSAGNPATSSTSARRWTWRACTSPRPGAARRALVGVFGKSRHRQDASSRACCSPGSSCRRVRSTWSSTCTTTTAGRSAGGGQPRQGPPAVLPGQVSDLHPGR